MNLGSNVNFLLGLQSQMRINHWQTKKHSRHVAFGDFYETMDGLVDHFMEVSMGKYGRFTLDEEDKSIPVFNMSELNIKSLLKNVNKSLLLLKDTLNKEDGDILNIIDEMVAEVNKLSYLLTQE
jgi:hypothetical protein